MSKLLFYFLIFCFVSCQQPASDTKDHSKVHIDSSLIGLRLDSVVAKLGILQSKIIFTDEPPRIYSRAVFSGSDSVETTFFFERTGLTDETDSLRKSAILFSKRVRRIEQTNLRTGVK